MGGVGLASGDVAAVEERLDVLTKAGLHTGVSKPRSLVHQDGDYHRAVHVWIYAESTGELLLQKRADNKDSWPGLWDISSAGHISAGDTSLITAQRELQEELGVTLPPDAFELLFVYLQECTTNNGAFINNEYNDVYLITTEKPIPLEAFTLQESEVSAVKYIGWKEFEDLVRKGDPAYVPVEVDGGYSRFFSAIRSRYEVNKEARILSLKTQLSRYVPTKFGSQLEQLRNGDRLAIPFIIQAAGVLERIFLEQEWLTNPALKTWLELRSSESELDELKLAYYKINKSPWSLLDENQAFLTTADSALVSAEKALKAVPGWEGLKYRAAFPVQKPSGANFYPSDMDKAEFEIWKSKLEPKEQEAATGFFTTIRRPSDPTLYNLKITPYPVEYGALLTQASKYLHTAGDLAETPSLKKLLKSKADAFLSNDYYDSDIAWMELDSPVDVTIGPYETYEDALYGYKATFEAFIGIRDEVATSRLKLFSERLQELEDNLPLASQYKSKGVTASPIRVIQLLYNAGDVKGPQTVAFNLPNDERIVNERGSAMVMLKNMSQAKFDQILKPIAEVSVEASQREYVDFESFFTHTICHECCHGIGPHSIVLPSGKESTVRLELQELHSSLEEAKADIVGLWALHYLLDRGLISENLEKPMYVSFLAGCFRSIRFGLEEAHGKGQAVQFNWILEKGGFVENPDGTFSVDFDQVRGAVESLSKEILTLQALGDKSAAKSLLDTYGVLTPPLRRCLSQLESVQVPIDVAPTFEVLSQIS